MSIDLERIRAAAAQHPRPKHFKPAYGTAGFRAEASLLDSTVFRCGLLTSARALVLGSHCGLMITASHNPEPDNGVKIVEPGGEMMTQAWEPLATELANADDADQVAALINRVVSGSSADAAQQLKVFLGCDTRPSSRALMDAAIEGVTAMGLCPVDLGCVTTPQLHFQVVALNSGTLLASSTPSAAAATDAAAVAPGSGTAPAPQPALTSLDLYYDTLLGAFEQLCASGSSAAAAGKAPVLRVDCANGVGAGVLQRCAQRLAGSGGSSPLLRLELVNEGSGRLNHLCGADYVQKEKKEPAGFGALQGDAADGGEVRCCSVDGDADRLVYFEPLPAAPAAATCSGPRGVALWDGDKIAALIAVLVRELLAGLPAEVAAGIRVGVVQTAYANGASTAFLTKVLGLEVACTPTGVKHLHEAAHHFDVGIYFEANGHGTALFSPELLAKLEQLPDCPAARDLLLLSRVINQAVGDAVSGVLAVEAILRRKGWGLAQWAALYTDLPSRQTKLTVKDRGLITTADAERRCVTPEGLQAAIDALVAEVPGGRSFVRPSGTEDAVRVYAEAATQAEADELAARVGRAVYDMAGGVGTRP